jgi:hypothetical protein
MRTITDHKLNGLNERLEITAQDKPGSGGANHTYLIEGYQNDEPAMSWPGGVRRHFTRLEIDFQNGPIQGCEDLNGITNEALLAVLIDRMRGFQGMAPVHGNPSINQLGKDPAPFRSRENACALTHLEEAMMWLQKRTRDRMARSVEGTHTP